MTRPQPSTDPILERSVGGKGEASGGERLPVAATPKSPALFRERAVEVHARGGMTGELVRISPPWATWLVLSIGALLLASVFGAAFARVDVTSLGRGILQANGAPQVVATQVAGTVASVSVRPGDHVEANQQIAQLESATTAAALLEASRRLELATRSLEHFRARTKPLVQARIARQRERVQSLAQRTDSQRTSEERMRKKSSTVEALKQQGLASDFDSSAAAELAASAHRELLQAQQENAGLREQVSATSAELVTEEWRLLVELEEARARRESLQFALDAAVVRSPKRGVVGALAVRPGDTLLVGSLVTRVVADGPPRTVVVYLPERDRAFVDVGSRVRVQVDQLPFWEFGSFSGKVTKVSSEIASERDLSDTLGDHVKLQEPMYRIDVALADDASYRAMSARLRPESLASVRFTLRQRRVLSVLFEPLRRWLE